MTDYINRGPHFLANLYDNCPALDNLAINDYQLLNIFWNIFLVFITFFIFFLLRRVWRKTKLKKIEQKVLAILLGFAWLLFAPNTAYIITDVRHLLNYCPLDSPDNVCLDGAWMIAFFFLYACLGWVSFYYALRLMSGLVEEIFSRIYANLFVVFSVPLISAGVLLGLINRWNSWDVFIHPVKLLKTSLIYLTDFHYFFNWLIFTIFLYFLYFIGRRLFKDSAYELFKNI